MTFFLILMGLMLNMLIGLTVIVLIDDQKHSLRFWVCSDALPGGRLVLFQLWPLVLLFWFFKEKK